MLSRLSIASHAVALIVLFMLVPSAQCAGADLPNEHHTKNLIPNSSFECGEVGWQSGIKFEDAHICNLFKLAGEVADVDGAPHGRKALSIKFSKPFHQLFLFSPHIAHAPWLLITNSRWLRLLCGETYTLSAFVKAFGNGIGVTIGVYFADGRKIERRIDPTNDWRRFSLAFKAVDWHALVVFGFEQLSPFAGDTKLGVDAVQLEVGETPTPYEPHSQVEVFIVSNSPNNIWVSEGDVGLRLLAYNDGDDMHANLDVRVCDFKGASIMERSLSIRVPSKGVADIPLENMLPKASGFYDVIVRPSDEAVRYVSSWNAHCALLRPFEGFDSPFGVEGFYPSEELLLLLKRMGILWWRYTIAKRSASEAPSSLDDENINKLLKLGMHVLISIPTLKDEDADSYASRFETIVKRYRTRVFAYEVFVSRPHLGGADEGGCMSKLVELIKVAYSSAKAINKDCVLVLGVGSMELALKLVKADVLKFADVINLCLFRHEYEWQVKDLIALMEGSKMRKPIWVTSGERCELSGSYEGELRNAVAIVRRATTLLSSGVSKIFYSLSYGTNCFLEVDGTPREALPAHSVLANMIAKSALPLGMLNLGKGACCYGFKRIDGVVGVVWLAREDAVVSLSLKQPARAFNLMGNELKTPTIELSDTPIYLVAPDVRSLVASTRLKFTDKGAKQ